MNKLISNNTKIKLRTVLFITLSWIALSVLIVYYNHLLKLSQEAFEFNDYDLENALFTNVFAVTIGGLVGGFAITFFLKDRLRKLPLGLVIIINLLSFVIIISLVSMAAFLFYYWVFIGESYFDGDLWFNITEFVSSYAFALNVISWSTISTITMIILQINDKYGRGVFFETLLGKYHSPINEERIFMFLDLKSSTSIAEKLGHKRYFKLLNRFFEDVTKAIIEREGEIYQYVGDEVVITWKLEYGVDKANCVRCFFDIEDIIQRKAHKYMAKYGVTPTFKAGLHCGEVTTGEVGTFKKDIIFTGDVLNTTSRIESKCNEFDKRLLISGELVSLLPLNEDYDMEELGDIDLRGKRKPVKVYSISRRFVDENKEFITDD
ncbi:adenylate/guanylate cyclase domain-containing protein [Fulvivirga maritima]|uniref:adenylate/guanylate cyclase domain-containing protein n=1 Tax=Fulvivirga maritima TaxID=2904247 RepID=UPI001F4349BC|nr:adenylate/guanylate cyclase domain-containing protein [Fulvivirga maritima]UII28206.1 adenylate/guanylate cyclase domain-containing protein [Fulvivirga maritima]